MLRLPSMRLAAGIRPFNCFLRCLRSDERAAISLTTEVMPRSGGVMELQWPPDPLARCIAVICPSVVSVAREAGDCSVAWMCRLRKHLWYGTQKRSSACALKPKSGSDVESCEVSAKSVSCLGEL